MKLNEENSCSPEGVVAEIKNLLDEYKGRLSASKRMQDGIESDFEEGCLYGRESAFEDIIDDLTDLINVVSVLFTKFK